MSHKNLLKEIGEIVDKRGSELLESRAKLKQLKAEPRKKIVFPVEAFPKKMQAIINILSECYGFPPDYYGASFLCVAGTILGNAYQAQYKHNWTAKATMYVAIVGGSSIGKSHTLKVAVKPMYQMEEDFQNSHLTQLELFKGEMEDYNNSKVKGEAPEPPPPKEILLNDATVEAIHRSMSHNPKGLLYFKDELSGWVHSMNQYRKGSDQEFWLENWQNTTVKINRQSKNPIYIKSPFVSVLGALTPSFLRDLAGGDRKNNGFIPRILFAFPDNVQKPYESENLPSPDTFDAYNEIIQNLQNFPHNIHQDPESPNDTITILLSEEARLLFKSFLRQNTDAINAAEDDTIKSIYGKLDSYCLRFALVLELLQIACDLTVQKNEDFPAFSQVDDFSKHQISKKSVERAILLSDYFKDTAFKVVERFDSPVNLLEHHIRIWYKSLPDEFTTQFAQDLGLDQEPKINKKMVERLLNNSKTQKPIFVRKGRGLYEKLFV